MLKNMPLYVLQHKYTKNRFFCLFFFSNPLESKIFKIDLQQLRQTNKFLNYNLMNKQELINAVAEKAGLSKADSKKAIDAITEAISGALKSGDKVALIGFGTFSVKESSAREGINPATKQKIKIAAKKAAKFKAGSELNAALN